MQNIPIQQILMADFEEILSLRVLNNSLSESVLFRQTKETIFPIRRFSSKRLLQSERVVLIDHFESFMAGTRRMNAIYSDSDAR